MNRPIPQPGNPDTDGDLNRVEITGVIITPPELWIDPYGTLIVSLLISSRSRWQTWVWGTQGQQGYLFPVIAFGAVGERLATLPVGIGLTLSGSLDYGYHPSATSMETQWRLAIRTERIELLQVPKT